MAPVLRITQAELLDALAATAKGDAPEHARTVQEMVADSGIDIRRVRNALHSLQCAGRLSVYKVCRPGLDGRSAVVPAYTIAPAQKAKRG